MFCAVRNFRLNCQASARVPTLRADPASLLSVNIFFICVTHSFEARAGPADNSWLLPGFTYRAPCSGIIQINPDDQPSPPFVVAYNQVRYYHLARPRTHLLYASRVNTPCRPFSNAAP